MNMNLDLGAAMRLADERVSRLEAELEAARHDRAVLQEAVEAVRRMNAVPAVQLPRSPSPSKTPVAEKSEVNTQILKVLTSDPIPLAELQKRILANGYAPKGQYFEAALRKALRRLAKREMVGTKVVEGRNFYFRQK